jgi:hypothetical protein
MIERLPFSKGAFYIPNVFKTSSGCFGRRAQAGSTKPSERADECSIVSRFLASFSSPNNDLKCKSLLKVRAVYDVV